MESRQDWRGEAAAAVSLREITREALPRILALSVSPGQERFVASNAVSIAQAYFNRETAWFRAIYAGETPVGFVMLDEQPERSRYFLWRFMLDHRHQRLGYGRRAIELLVEHVRGRPGVTELLVSCVPGEGGPCPFYERMGFTYTGDVDEGELVMRRSL
jgi:diamine N-acetyltransferase